MAKKAGELIIEWDENGVRMRSDDENMHGLEVYQKLFDGLYICIMSCPYDYYEKILKPDILSHVQYILERKEIDKDGGALKDFKAPIATRH